MTTTEKTITVNLTFTFLPVAYWAYEHAFCERAITRVIEAADSDRVYELHGQFAQAFGVDRDNKQTFAVEDLNDGSFSTLLFFTFHDNRMFVGAGIRPYRGDVLQAPDKEINPSSWIEWNRVNQKWPIKPKAH